MKASDFAPEASRSPAARNAITRPVRGQRRGMGGAHLFDVGPMMRSSLGDASRAGERHHRHLLSFDPARGGGRVYFPGPASPSGGGCRDSYFSFSPFQPRSVTDEISFWPKGEEEVLVSVARSRASPRWTFRLRWARALLHEPRHSRRPGGRGTVLLTFLERGESRDRRTEPTSARRLTRGG